MARFIVEMINNFYPLTVFVTFFNAGVLQGLSIPVRTSSHIFPATNIFIKTLLNTYLIAASMFVASY